MSFEKLQDIDHSVVANSNSKIYHSPKCHCVPKILSSNIVDIDMAHYDIKGRDYRPCCKCLSEMFKIWDDENKALDLLEKGQMILQDNQNNCLKNIIDSVNQDCEHVYGLAWNRKQDHEGEEAL